MRTKTPTKSKVSKPKVKRKEGFSGKVTKTNTFYRQGSEKTPSSTSRGKVKSRTPEGKMKLKAVAVKSSKPATSVSKESLSANKPERRITNLSAVKTASDITKRKPKASF